MRVLAVSPLHESSVAIVNNGEVEAFYKEERVTRVKRDAHPFTSVERILNEAAGPIDYVAVGTPAPDNPALVTWLTYLQKRTGAKQVIDLSKSHHLQHASLAFYNSGFNEAAIVIVDRCGTLYGNKIRESETIFKAGYPCQFEEVYKKFWYDEYDEQAHIWLQNAYKNKKFEIDYKSMLGIVLVYETATSLIEQHPLENGKTMGLASYGNPSDNPPELFLEGNVPNELLFIREPFKDGPGWRSAHRDLYKHSQKIITLQNFQFYADYAYQVQTQTQDAVCYLIEKAIKKTGLKKICISGGYGLNIVANYYYTTKFPDVEFYFEPLADDSGNSIGMAQFVYRNESQDSTIKPLKDTFVHGKKHNLDNINGQLVSASEIAKLIYDNNSVAVFNGLAESGPRALGNRSLLFNPLNPLAKDIVNRIKKREWYRPFAAMVLEEDAGEYFEMGNIKKSPFMAINFPVKDLKSSIIPGVTHVDNTCRIQTVSSNDGHIYELLTEFKNISGHGILLNTSLNLAGDPLVETVDDLLDMMNRSELSYVWFPEIKKILKK